MLHDFFSCVAAQLQHRWTDIGKGPLQIHGPDDITRVSGKQTIAFLALLPGKVRSLQFLAFTLVFGCQTSPLAPQDQAVADKQQNNHHRHSNRQQPARQHLHGFGMDPSLVDCSARITVEVVQGQVYCRQQFMVAAGDTGPQR